MPDTKKVAVKKEKSTVPWYRSINPFLAIEQTQNKHCYISDRSRKNTLS